MNEIKEFEQLKYFVSKFENQAIKSIKLLVNDPKAEKAFNVSVPTSKAHVWANLLVEDAKKSIEEMTPNITEKMEGLNEKRNRIKELKDELNKLQSELNSIKND